MVFNSRKVSWFKGMGNPMWFISYHEEEGGGIAGAVFLVVVDEFSHRKVLHPLIGHGSAVNP